MFYARSIVTSLRC